MLNKNRVNGLKMYSNQLNEIQQNCNVNFFTNSIFLCTGNKPTNSGLTEKSNYPMETELSLMFPHCLPNAGVS